MEAEPKSDALMSPAAFDTLSDAPLTVAETPDSSSDVQANEELLVIPTPCTALSSSAPLSDRHALSPPAAEVSLQVPRAVSARPTGGTTLRASRKGQPSALPNASVGKPYRVSVRQIFGDQENHVELIKFSGLEGSGLIFDNEYLHGTPEKAGELSLELTYSLAATAVGRPDVTQPLALTINPDPTSLWKNLASDHKDPFWKKDEIAERLDTPHLTALAASLRGRSHAHEGKYRDDHFAIGSVETTGWHIFVVADGAGSAEYGRGGSQIVCCEAMHVLKSALAAQDRLDDALEKFPTYDDDDYLYKLRIVACNLLVKPAYQAFAKIRLEAAKKHVTPRDFATTLILVIAKRVGAQWFFASFAIGDGGAGVIDGNKNLTLLTKADIGEFAGQTIFLTTTPQLFKDEAALLLRTEAVFCNEFEFLAVMTDGVTDPIFRSEASFADRTAWNGWRRDLSQKVSLDEPKSGMEQALLDYLRFQSPGYHDDRTLILVVPKSPCEQP